MDTFVHICIHIYTHTLYIYIYITYIYIYNFMYSYTVFLLPAFNAGTIPIFFRPEARDDGVAQGLVGRRGRRPGDGGAMVAP